MAEHWVDNLDILNDCIFCDLRHQSEWIDQGRLWEPPQRRGHIPFCLESWRIGLNQEGKLAGHDAGGIARIDAVDLAVRVGCHTPRKQLETVVGGMQINLLRRRKWARNFDGSMIRDR